MLPNAIAILPAKFKEAVTHIVGEQDGLQNVKVIGSLWNWTQVLLLSSPCKDNLHFIIPIEWYQEGNILQFNSCTPRVQAMSVYLLNISHLAFSTTVTIHFTTRFSLGLSMIFSHHTDYFCGHQKGQLREDRWGPTMPGPSCVILSLDSSFPPRMWHYF